MRKIKINKTFAYVLIVILLLQIGIVGYSMVTKEFFSNSSDVEVMDTEDTYNTEEGSQTSTTVDSAIIVSDDNAPNTEISQEIQNLIKQSDPDNFDKNLNNYKNLLTNLNVHSVFKDEIEALIIAGNSIKDILISYEFIYDSYGTKAELEDMLAARKSGEDWVSIFKTYNTKNPEFKPSSFESDYLKLLFNTSGINKDDIIIADRVAKKMSIKFEDVINLKKSVPTWKNINASFGILNSQQQMPHITINPEQIKTYKATGLSQDNIVGAMMIALKLGTNEADVVNMVKEGLTNEEIYAKSLEAKYY